MYHRFSKRVIRAAAGLSAGESGGSYFEACLLLSALISGLAADVWPGDGQDKKRFIELWATCADPVLGANRISVPLLVAHLREQGRLAQADAVSGSRREMFGLGYDARVVTGDDVDADEVELVAGGLSPKEVRQFSYGALFYKHVRCGIVHEYSLGEGATDVPMTSREDASVSYSNTVEFTDDPRRGRRTHRRIVFRMRWLLRLTEAFALHLDGTSRPAVPQRWWIEG